MRRNERRGTPTAIKDKVGGKILSSKEERKRWWKEHFQDIHVLNRPQPDHPLEVESELKGQFTDEIDTGPIRKIEIIRAIKKLKNGKSGGVDGITAEMLKADIEATTKYLEKLFETIWSEETQPSIWNKRPDCEDTKER